MNPALERQAGTIPYTPKRMGNFGEILEGWRWQSAARRAHSQESSPAILPGHDFEASRVPDHLVEGTDHLGEAGPCIPVLLPTVQHELVQGSGAVWGRGEPVVLFNGIDHLE